jgi:DNA-binding transcriptional regulator YiaG
VKARDVAELRKGLGKTQGEFADMLGVQLNSVWRWENGYPIHPAYERLLLDLRARTADVVPQSA